MSTKLLMDSLRLADGGRVECKLAAPDGTVVAGIIDEQFFEDFTGKSKPKLSVAEYGRIISENQGYFELRATELWQQGNREIIIR